MVKKIRPLLTLILPYWPFAFLNVLFNLLSALLSLVSLTLLIPFLHLLFDQVKPVLEAVPWAFTMESLTHNFNYYLSRIILEKGKFPALAFITSWVVVLFFLRNMTRYLAMYLVAPMRTGVVRDIRNSLYDKILILPIGYFTAQRKGDILSRASNDVTEVEWSVMNSLMMLFRDPLTILIFLLTLMIISPWLTLLILGILPLAGLIINYLGKILNRYAAKGQRKLGALVAIIEESIHGIRIIKAFNAFGLMNDRFGSLNGSYTRMMNRVYRRRELATPLTEFLTILALAAVIWVGGRMVLHGENRMEAGVFLFYLAVFSQLIPPAKNLITAYYYIEKGLASFARVREVLEAAEVILEAPLAKPVERLEREIRYEKVSFSYTGEPVLRNIDLVIGKGRKVAVVGPSGAGKSTLADLLPRFYDSTGGRILIDGVPVTDLKINDLRSLFGIVTQETILFNDTIYNNIAFGLKNAGPGEVYAAAELANAHEFILAMPEGYQTNIGDRGVKLSGGQRQRLSLARAILRKPEVFILDEATSALDAESEVLVQQALDNILRDSTALIIAHRLSTLKIADEILVLQHGTIAERGTHAELLAATGLYYRLYHQNPED